MEKVYIVGAGPGDPKLITVRGMELLMQAEVLIYAGSLVSPELVAASPAREKYNSYGMNRDELVELMAGAAAAGKTVIRLHSGDPSLYGAIVEQIAGLEEKGISVEIVPGVSSMFGAAAALRTQLALKGVSESVIITRPAGKTRENDRIRELSRFGSTMVIFLGTDKIEGILSSVEYPHDTPVAVVYHATWPDEQVIVGTVGDIAGKVRRAGIEKSALIIIGNVVLATSSRFKVSDLYT